MPTSDAGGYAHGAACADRLAIVLLADVDAFLLGIAGTPPREHCKGRNTQRPSIGQKAQQRAAGGY